MSLEPPPPATGQRATRTRYWVIVLAITLAVVQYVDRVAISQAKGDIAREMSFTDVQMGAIFGAFGLAYALFEIPTGWLGDKIGARKVLIRVVLWWSFFTAATGWAWSYVSMWWMRFLFGAGEAGCFPNLTKAFSAWLPKNERTRAQALMWMGARWGGAFTPMLVVMVMAFVNWRTAFQIFAALGVVWVVVFWLWFRDNPRDHKGVNAAERELLKENEQNVRGHGDVPWLKLVKSPTMWMLWAQYFCLSYGWYFYVTWLPTYLKEERNMDIKSNAFMNWLAGLLEGSLSPELTIKVLAAALAGIPLFFGGFGSLVSGLISNRMIRSGSRVLVVRRAFGVIGFTGASGLLMTSFYLKDPLVAMLAMGMASFFNDLTMPGSWSACMDIGGKYAGTISGSMNMMGNFGGMAGPVVVGIVLAATTVTTTAGTTKNWELVFAISSAIYFLGAFFWLFIDPVTPLEKAEEAPGQA
ncbi:MAG TPA: MFS transporter [Opitutaceae bacterium]|nr:MFS transporter [Opitutaceae bacterium]